jgi:hypothetical protein
MTGCVAVPRVKGRNERGRKRQICALQANIRRSKLLRRLPLLSVQPIQALRRKTWREEQEDRPFSRLAVRVCKYNQRGYVNGEARNEKWLDRSQEGSIRSGTTKRDRDSSEARVNQRLDQGCRDNGNDELANGWLDWEKGDDG